jgi:hypothetical protein
MMIDVKAAAASLACILALGSLCAVVIALVGNHPWPDYSLGYWLISIALLWVVTILFELATLGRSR